LGLLNDVLDIARIDSGQLSMSLEPDAVSAVLKDVLTLVQPLADARDITLETSYTGFSRSYVLADNQRLRQVLINLLSNAIKYNRPGGAIMVSVVDSDPFVRIGVMDTGLGLTEEQISRLFTPFERLDAQRMGVEGTGLGLALSRELITAMGGTLDVTSSVDVGSTFTIELQLVEPNVVTNEVDTHDDTLDVRSYGASRQVLYVEDMVANARLVEEILKRRPDVTLLSAMLGGLALELAQEYLPDLILLDLHLPDMDGMEVLRRLRADERTADIPVVVLSADATGVHADQLLAEGARLFLTKPLGVSKLLEVVDRFLLEP
jgi:CheY-like chemotaxis protein